jgi:hypothetical protein
VLQTLLILGATGDLTGRLLLPGLGALLATGAGDGLMLLGSGTQDWDDGGRRRVARRQPGRPGRPAAPPGRPGVVATRAPPPHPRRARRAARSGAGKVAAAVRAARRDRAADFRGRRAALERPLPGRRAAARAGAARDRQGRRCRSEVAPRCAPNPAHRPACRQASGTPSPRRRDDAFVFPGRDGRASDQGSLRRRVLVPAAERAGLTGVGFHTLRIDADRVRPFPAAPAALDGPPLAGVHARDLRPPDRRGSRPRA